MSAPSAGDVAGVATRTQRPDPAAATARSPLTVRLLRDGGYTTVPESSVVVYQIGSDDHRQTGVLVEVPVDHYRRGHIRGHETTEPARERRIVQRTMCAGVESMPVTLTHLPRTGLRSLLAGVTDAPPDVALTERGSTHAVWVRTGSDVVDAVHDELGSIGALYVADGHHRMGAAQQYADSYDGYAGGFTLAALFPSDEMRILGYHRFLARPRGMSAAHLRRELAAAPVTARVEECECAELGGQHARPGPGVVAVYLDGRWFRLVLRAPSDHAGVRASLDVVALDEGVLSPELGILDADVHVDAKGPAGGSDPEDVACWCDEHDAIAFVLHPPTIEEVMAVADAGSLLPAKSTWFTPKARDGLFVRELKSSTLGSTGRVA